MKTKITFLSLLLLLGISGCNNIKKQYKDGQEVWNGVKGAKYDDIVKVWGDPNRTIVYDDRIDCIWTNVQVSILEGSMGDVTLSFDKWLTPFGAYEGIGLPHDLDCGDWQYYDDHKMKIHRVDLSR